MSDIRIVRSLPDSVWRQFIEKHPYGNIFHTPEMFEVFARTKSHRPTLWAVTDIDGHLLALLLPVEVTVIDGIFRSLTTRALVYGSVLWEPSEQGMKALALLLKTYTSETRKKVLFTELRNVSNLKSVQPILHDYDFVYEDHLNYLIDLSASPEAVFMNIGSRTRKNIRRGLNRGKVVIEELKAREQVMFSYKLLRKTYRSAQVPLAHYSMFEAAFDVLYPKGMIRFTQARIDQKDVATSVDLLYKDVIYGWYGGVDREYSAYVPNEILMWNILQWGAENGYAVYDFGGAGKPDEKYGVRDFKAKFGGDLVCYGRNICVHNPLMLQLSTAGYSILRGWLSR